MSNLAHGIGVPVEVVKGHQLSRRAVEAAIARWENTRRLVIRQMAQKGFSQEQVEAALVECDSMLDFYDTLLESYE